MSNAKTKEILCSVVAEGALEDEETEQLIKQHRIKRYDEIITTLNVFDVPESEVESLTTALRKLGCSDIDDHGRV